MKNKKFMPINTVVYTYKLVTREGLVGFGYEEITSTKYASFCVINSHPKHLLPLVMIIAKQHKLDIDKEDQFKYGMELLKSAVSWN